MVLALNVLNVMGNKQWNQVYESASVQQQHHQQQQ